MLPSGYCYDLGGSVHAITGVREIQEEEDVVGVGDLAVPAESLADGVNSSFRPFCGAYTNLIGF